MTVNMRRVNPNLNCHLLSLISLSVVITCSKCQELEQTTPVYVEVTTLFPKTFPHDQSSSVGQTTPLTAEVNTFFDELLFQDEDSSTTRSPNTPQLAFKSLSINNRPSIPILPSNFTVQRDRLDVHTGNRSASETNTTGLVGDANLLENITNVYHIDKFETTEDREKHTDHTNTTVHNDPGNDIELSVFESDSSVNPALEKERMPKALGIVDIMGAQEVLTSNLNAVTQTGSSMDYPIVRENGVSALAEEYVYEDVPGNESFYEYYDYDEYSENMRSGISVRKCCAPNKLFIFGSSQCEVSPSSSGFTDLMNNLLTEQHTAPVEVVTNDIEMCERTNLPPDIVLEVSNLTFVLDHGFLHDLQNDLHFDRDNYCLELVTDKDETQNLVVKFCHAYKPASVETLRKCCPENSYFDPVAVKCVPKIPGIPSIKHLAEEFSGKFVENTSFVAGNLECPMGSPVLKNPEDVYLSERGQLCILKTGRCYPNSLYCVEYIWSPDQPYPQASAIYCPLDAFQKCCPLNEVVFNGTCIPTDKHLSSLMTQVKATKDYRVGFPPDNGEVCVQLTLDEYDDVFWWITNAGYLAIDTGKNYIETMNYCVDDSITRSGKRSTEAYVCTDELKKSAIALPIKAFEKKTIGKCCATGNHLSPSYVDCVLGSSDHVLQSDSTLDRVNFSELVYTGLPRCTSKQYHLYTFRKDSDHVEFDSNSVLNAVSMDGKCVERKTPIPRENYCLDYGWDADEPQLVSVIMCVTPWENVTDLHLEKPYLTTVCLAISCLFLVVTLVKIILNRREMKKFPRNYGSKAAQRLQGTYVSVTLAGFLLLMLSINWNTDESSAFCKIIAAGLQFFLLSGFFWNTCFCFNLLHMVRNTFSTAHWRMYLYYSAWGWGVPAVITLVTVAMDAARDHLPCGTVTARVGRLYCFFSDPYARLLYFYVPIAFTLVINVGVLVTYQVLTNRATRVTTAGPKDKSKEINGNTTAGEKKTTSTQGPGLRMNQNRDVRSRSMKLVVWSGGTWFFEVLGFVMTRFVSHSQERWHDYLWHIPSVVNALRGLGIFWILTVTPETRRSLRQLYGTIKSKSSIFWSSESSAKSKVDQNFVTRKESECSVNHHSSQTDRCRHGGKTRNSSVTTVTTEVPSSQSSFTHPRLSHSISQIERRFSNASSNSGFSESEDSENLEMSTGRRVSLAPLPLAVVDEEHGYEQESD